MYLKILYDLLLIQSSSENRLFWYYIQAMINYEQLAFQFLMQIMQSMILFLQQITVSAFSSQMININTRKDERISQCFPNDPYSNICIITTTQKLNLQHAFLSMDSGYFARIDPDAHEVDLRELREESLVRVLHSLYGEELIVNSMTELAQLLPIILYLEIQQYRKNIEQQILQNKHLKENVELIQLAYRHKFLWHEILSTHLQNDLALLENTRCYLQLGKLENDTFNALLTAYIDRGGDKNDKILNNVMENYFNRKNIKAIPYLQSHNLTRLLKIWMNYHHVFQISTPQAQLSTLKKIESVTPQNRIIQKQRRIKLMEQEIIAKDETIHKMQQEIKQLKAHLGIRQKLGTAKSLFINTVQITQNPASKQKPENNRRSKMSPTFKSCIYTQIKKDERKSSSKQRTYNRFGSKNLKRWS